jgi:putative transcriptional regulator
LITINLKSLLNQHDISQRKLSKELGIRQPTLSAIVNNDIKHIPVDVIDRICEYINCQPGDLMKHISADKNAPDSPAARQPNHQSAPKPAKEEKHYRAFTEAGASRVDLQELTTNIKYQLDIGETFGMNVLADLLQNARQQQEEKATTKPINDTL